MRRAHQSRRALVRTAAVVAIVALSSPAYAAPPAPTTESNPSTSTVETTFKSVDAVVAGQWDFPTRSPAPLVVLIPSGGRIDRNGWHPGLGEDPAEGIYSQLTQRLVREGFAVFRYDKPGAGRSSPGHYATERSSALEAYTRAVDHGRIDPERIYLLGHSLGCDTIAGIYPRFVSVAPPAGAILLDNVVGETDSVRIEAPILLINPGKDPDDRYQYGEFVAEARSRASQSKLETELVIIDDAEPGLLAGRPKNGEFVYSIHPRAVEAVVGWLMRHAGSGATRPQARGGYRDTPKRPC